MYNSHDIHFHERYYIKQVVKYLLAAYGKTIEELAISVKEIAEGLHNNLHPTEFVDNNAQSWGIHRVASSIPGTAPRIVHI
jgi:predicted metal-dependent HD superfamily phosphohydrolase